MTARELIDATASYRALILAGLPLPPYMAFRRRDEPPSAPPSFGA